MSPVAPNRGCQVACMALNHGSGGGRIRTSGQGIMRTRRTVRLASVYAGITCGFLIRARVIVSAGFGWHRSQGVPSERALRQISVDQVRVRRQKHGRVRVTSPDLNRLYVHAAVQEQRQAGVAQRVRCRPRGTRRRRRLREPAMDVRRVDVPAAPVREHQRHLSARLRRFTPLPSASGHASRSCGTSPLRSGRSHATDRARETPVPPAVSSSRPACRRW